MSDARRQRAHERLRAVLFVGEVFPVNYLRSLMQVLPRAAFYHLS